MSITTRQRRQVPANDRTRNTVTVVVAALTGAVGIAIALGLARATEYAEQVEEDEYCHPTDGVPAG